jgi:hypothetical protein
MAPRRLRTASWLPYSALWTAFREGDRARIDIDGEIPSNQTMVAVQDFTTGSPKTSLSTCRVSKDPKLPLELLAYCIMVRPYRVSERLEVVLGHRLDTI